MSSAIFIRGFARNCVKAGSNGVCRSRLAISPELCRAFAVAPLTSALQTSSSLTAINRRPTQLLSPNGSGSQTAVVRSSSSGDHVKLWTAERVLSAALLGAIPAAIAMPTPAIETILALSLTVHGHWGIEAIVHDYVRPSMFGETIPKVSVAAVYGLSCLTFGSLCYFIYTDVGLINAVTMFWKL